jgi:ABC-type Fe3+/spermidine/putrescine transport system ATPase subunit
MEAEEYLRDLLGPSGCGSACTLRILEAAGKYFDCTV